MRRASRIVRAFVALAAVLIGVAGGARLPAQSETRADGRADVRAGTAQDDRRLLVETTTPRTFFYAGERVPIRVRIAYDAAFFAESALPLLRRRTDVPLLVSAPFFSTPPAGWSVAAAPTPTGSGNRTATLALGDDIATAVRRPEISVDGKPYAVLEIERDFRADAAGETTLAPATVRYAFATSFTEDFLGARTPADRREAEVAGRPLLLRVLPPPTFGRPAEFAGAVGRFTMQAALDRAEGVVGESLKLALTIEGAGGDAAFPIPRLDGMRGLPVLARIVRTEGTAVIATYELALDDATVTEVPPASLAFFDPEASPPAYRVVRTAALPIAVRPRATATNPASRAAAAAPNGDLAAMADILPTGDMAPRDLPRPLGSRTIGTALAMPWLMAVVALLVRRRRRWAAQDGGGRAARRAASVLSRSLRKRGEPADAFAAYLAARLRTDVPSVIAPDLRERLCRAGVENETAARAARLLESLLSVRYGGAAPADAPVAVATLAKTLESEFRREEGRR